MLDVDPGIDDTIAIITALKSENLEIEAITTVKGNVSVEAGYVNALTVLNLFNRKDIPVIQGSANSLGRPISSTIKNILEKEHGKSGLGDLSSDIIKQNIITTRNAGRKTTKDYIDFIDDLANKLKNDKIAIVATGPLTNIAVLVAERPSFIESYVKEICIMGGAFGVTDKKIIGNVTAHSEFNFYCDPEAAKIVFSRLNDKMKVVGLDVTLDYKNSFEAEFINEIKNQNKSDRNNYTHDDQIKKFITSLFDFKLSHNNHFYVHDVFAILMLEQITRLCKKTQDLTYIATLSYLPYL
jgi:purine nucleosidase